MTDGFDVFQLVAYPVTRYARATPSFRRGINKSQPCAVVAAVFKFCEPIEDACYCVGFSQKSYYSAHIMILLRQIIVPATLAIHCPSYAGNHKVYVESSKFVK